MTVCTAAVTSVSLVRQQQGGKAAAVEGVDFSVSPMLSRWVQTLFLVGVSPCRALPSWVVQTFFKKLMHGIAWVYSVNREEADHTAPITHFLRSVCDKVISEAVDTDND